MNELEYAWGVKMKKKVIEDGVSPTYPKGYTEKEVEDMLRTLAKYIDDDMNGCYLPITCAPNTTLSGEEGRARCIKCMIDYAKNNPTEKDKNE